VADLKEGSARLLTVAPSTSFLACVPVIPDRGRRHSCLAAEASAKVGRRPFVVWGFQLRDKNVAPPVKGVDVVSGPALEGGPAQLEVASLALA